MSHRAYMRIRDAAECDEVSIEDARFSDTIASLFIRVEPEGLSLVYNVTGHSRQGTSYGIAQASTNISWDALVSDVQSPVRIWFLSLMKKGMHIPQHWIDNTRGVKSGE